MNPNPTAWLFDLDGTLVDSERASVRAWSRIADRYAIDLDAILRVHGGRPPEGTLALAAPQLPPATVAEALADLWRGLYDDVSDVTAHAGAHDLIRAIESAGRPWAIVTACDRRLAAARLGAAGITPATRMPAARPAWTPAAASSTTRHSAGGTSRRAAASK